MLMYHLNSKNNKTIKTQTFKKFKAMKKIILSAAILAVAASCSKNEVVDLPKANQIGFYAMNDNVTKVANDVATGVDYKVYANVIKAGTPATSWLINDDVVGTTDLATAGPYYWPMATDEVVDFYAYAPASAVITDLVATSGATTAVTFGYEVPAGAQEDFTIAGKCDDYTVTQETANFTFAHKLSKVTIKVDLTDELKTSGYTLDPNYESAISVFQTKSAVDVCNETLTPATTATTLTAYDVDDTNVYYIMPQATENCQIQLQDIKVNHTSGSSLFGDAVVDLKEITLGATAMSGADFAEGKHYVVTVTVGGDATTEDDKTLTVIKFSAASADWGTDIEQGVDQI